MEANVTAILTDERGWQKPFELREGLYWLGASEKAAIRIPGIPEIAPYHLQIVNLNSEDSVRLINLIDTSIILQKGGGSTLLGPNQCADIHGPEILHLGPYTLHFKLDKLNVAQPASKAKQEQVIGLRLVMSDVVLRPNVPIAGTLTLQNLGDRSCQFKVELDGLPPECYVIAPPPLIHPGGEESLEIEIRHQKIAPRAGQHPIILRVSAVEVYPGEEASVEQIIRVTPYYEHTLSFAAGLQAGQAAPDPEFAPQTDAPQEPIEPVAPEPQQPEPILSAAVLEEAATTAISEHPAEEIQSAPPPVAEEQTVSPAEARPQTGEPNPVPTARPSKRPDLSAAKVMKANSGDFLDKRTNQE